MSNMVRTNHTHLTDADKRKLKQHIRELASLGEVNLESDSHFYDVPVSDGDVEIALFAFGEGKSVTGPTEKVKMQVSVEADWGEDSGLIRGSHTLQSVGEKHGALSRELTELAQSITTGQGKNVGFTRSGGNSS